MHNQDLRLVPTPQALPFRSGVRDPFRDSTGKKTIVMLHEAGWSYREIAAEVGLHWARVGQIIKSTETS